MKEQINALISRLFLEGGGDGWGGRGGGTNRTLIGSD